MLKPSRLIQPHNPQFWLLVALNGLSAAIAFILRSHELAPFPALLLAVFAIGNVWLGWRIALRLMAEPGG
jgi:hypothetical protein